MSQCLSPEKRVTFLRCLYSMLKRFPCLYVYIYIYTVNDPKDMFLCSMLFCIHWSTDLCDHI